MCHISTHNTFFWAYFWWIMGLWSRWVPLSPYLQSVLLPKSLQILGISPFADWFHKNVFVTLPKWCWMGVSDVAREAFNKKNCLTWDTPKGRSHKDWDLGSVVAIPDHGLLFGSPLFRQTLGQGDEDSCSWCGKHSDLIWPPLGPIWSVLCIPFICQFLSTSAR